MKNNLAITVVSLLVLLFSYTAVSKALHYSSFVQVISQIAALKQGAAVIGVLVPSTELMIVLLLLYYKTRLIGLYASLALLFIFTVYLVYMILFVPHLPCSCGSVIGKMSWKGHVGFNVAFMVATMIGIRNVRREK